MKKLAIAALIFLISLTLLSGCAKKEDYAIKVNSQVVSRESYNAKLKVAKDYYTKQGLDFSNEQGQETLANVQSQVLEELISSKLISQEIAKNKWDVNNLEVSKQIEALKNQLPNKDYKFWLDEQAITNGDVVNYYTFTTNAAKDVTVTDQEIKQYFDANFSNYGGQQEQVKARHILVKTEQEALDIIKQLKAGADFATLAKEKSIDTGSKDAGGDLGYFPKGQMVAEFEAAAFSQKINEIPDKPVKTEYGYHVIQVEDHKQAVIPDFEKVKDNVKTDALAYAKTQKIQSYYTKLRHDAKVEYAEDLKPSSAK